MLFFYYFIEICIWAIGVEDLIAVHDGYEVLGVGEVDDVVGVTWEHDDRLDLVTRYFIVEDLSIRIGFVSQLDESMP